MSWIITRPINSINGDECICGSDGTACKFNSIAEAKEFLAKNGYTEMEIEDEGIDFVETNEDEASKTSDVRNVTVEKDGPDFVISCQDGDECKQMTLSNAEIYKIVDFYEKLEIESEVRDYLSDMDPEYRFQIFGRKYNIPVERFNEHISEIVEIVRLTRYVEIRRWRHYTETYDQIYSALFEITKRHFYEITR